MNSVKERVIELFLEFLGRHVPLSEARIATLGGHGIEPQIWERSGIPSDHGRLIEGNRRRGLRLIARHRYSTHDRLETFYQMTSGLGYNAFLDGFHLDLCGTVTDRVATTLAQIFPLICKGRGKCLAITVADARRNRVLESWPDIEKRARKLFGTQAGRFYREIKHQQTNIPVRRDLPAFMSHFSPVKATKREFGLLVEIADMMNQNPSCVLLDAERYVYISRYANSPFRMRTYFLHFGIGAGDSCDLARIWTSSQLLFSAGKKFAKIETDSMLVETTLALKEGYVMTSKLADIVKVVGGEVEAEYNQLVEDQMRLRNILRVMQQVSQSPGLLRQQEIRAPDQLRAAVVSAPTAMLVPRRRNWKNLSTEEQIEWLLKVRQLKARCGGKLETKAWRELLKTDFGYYSQALGRTLRAALAHTSGAYRKNFEARIRSTFGVTAPMYLERLSKL